MAKREKRAVMAVKSIEEAERVMAEYATADARIAKLNADMDVEITKIREKHSVELSELDELRAEKFNALQHFAESNEELFDKKKSVLMSHGIIGFRTGTPKLKPRRGFTWAGITELLKIKLPTYVRTVEEPAKDKLLADRENEAVNKYFEKCGFEVAQDETFYVELKKEGE